MQNAIEQQLAALGGRTSCIVIRGEKAAPNHLVSINPEQAFPAASLAKIPILIEVARQVAAGYLAWEERYAVPQEARLPGAGVLADLAPDLRLTLHDLAHLMITISDNTAANVLLDIVGMDAVNAAMRDLGLTSTRLERRFMDFAARQAGRDNWTTPADMSLALAHLCGEALPYAKEMLAILLRQNDRTILPAYWSEDILFAHKTGGLEGIIHDAGILYPPQSPDIPLIIVAMTAGQVDAALTRYTLAQVGKIIYEEHLRWLSPLSS
jgi:beta-lactamase class A